ncbi:hypothetical protein N9O63_00980 [Candidatus Pelagibacter sp.]|nr:hypothetical protein [Candidatus Pelagibacter sp.]
MTKLRIGLIIDSTNVNIYKKNLVEYILNNNQYFDDPVLISQNFKKKQSKHKIKNFLRFFLFEFFYNLTEKIIYKLINLFEIRRVRKNVLYCEYAKLFNLDKYNLKLVKVYPTVSKSGFLYRFSQTDLNLIKSLNLDVLVRCGSGIHMGEILSLNKFGILSFHHGDNRVNRGSPPGFWETYFNWPTTGFIIQRLTEQLDGGDVICRGNIMTRSLWHENTAQLFLKSNIFMFKVLKSLYKNNSLPSIEPAFQYGGKIFKKPSIYQLIFYIFKEYPKIIKSKIYLLFNFKKRWSVSFINKTGLDIDVKNLITIKNPPNRYLADPFVIKHNNKNICFVEDFYFKDNRAKISAFELNGNSYKEVGVALEEDFHLSFPYIFKDNDDIFMIPETAQNKDIRLYKCLNFPLKWKLEKVLMSNIDAVDTVVFKKEHKWYMLSNICSSFIGEHHSELHLFESDNLINNIWNKSYINPVIFNSQKARNGGFFSLGTNLYRVNQVHLKDKYGYSFKINKIKSINKNLYIENEISEIKPIFFKSLIGTHHFHMNDEYTVIDHCKISR